MLEIRLLGQFEVRVNDAPVVIPSRLAQSLLAYLLVHRACSHRREKRAGLFWPDKSETNARRSLRQELWRLRKILDPYSDLLLSDDLSIGIDPHCNYWLDVARLEEIEASRSTDDLMRSLDVYRGELLPDFYDEWVTVERERLRALFEQQVERLLEQLCGEQRWKETLTWAERWITLGHSPEPAYRAMMIAHNALGNRSQVAEVFGRCLTTLKTDLGVEPSEQTLGLYEQLAKDESRMLGMKDEEKLMRLGVALSFILPPASFDNEPPYKGLHYFDENDANLFFGRERLVATLVEDLAEHHWLTVVGASGSGKTSLARAGLIPALKAASRDWIIHILTPTAHPLEALAIQLTRGTESTTATTMLIDDLARDARALRIHCSKSIDASSRLLLVIDQFEELFTLCRDECERQRFIDSLLRATAPELDQPIYVVVALRADLYEQCAVYANLREALSQRQEFIGPMTTEGMRRAIEEPAARGKWELEPGLVELILRDVGNEPGALPLLSHALLETWKRRRERVLTLEGYANCGGVRGAIAQTAETVYARFDSREQEIARRIFLQLTELGEGTPDTRRRMARDELIHQAGEASQVRPVLNSLGEARLVTLGENTVEVAHEALIREWQRLRDWSNQDREGLRLHRQLTQAAREWEALKRDAGALYRGARLAQAVEWSQANPNALNDQERAFLDASVEEEHREEIEREAQRQRELQAAQKLAETQTRAAKQLRHRAYFLAGAFVLAIVLAFIALFFGEQARTSAVLAQDTARIAFARELSVNAVSNLNVDPERSILLAMQAVSVSTAGGNPALREAEEALHRAVMTSRVRMTLRGHTGYVYDATFSPDGKLIATASQDKTAKIWDAATGKELLTLTGHTDRITKVAFSPDGKRLATASTDKTTKVWDLNTGKELMTLQDDQENNMVAFNPDGTQIATGCGYQSARVWDAATGKLLFTFGCQPEAPGIHAFAYSPDGKRIAVRDVEMTAKAYDTETGKELLALGKPEVRTMYVYVAYSPDGKRIATATMDGAVNVWDAMSGRALLSFTASPTIRSFAFDRPLGTRLITGHNDGTIKVWDVSSTLTQASGSTTGQLLFTLAGHGSSIWGVEASPDGKQLVTASYDSTVRIWDITDNGTSEWLTIADGACCNAIYSPDGKRLIGASRIDTSRYGTNRMNVWDATTGQLLRTIDTGQMCGGDVSRDQKRFVTVTCGTVAEHTAKVWDLDTGNQLFSAPTANIDDLTTFGYGAAFHPDGMHIAAATGKGNITIWDVNSGREVMTLSGHMGNVNILAYSPDGTILASSAENVKIWDAPAGKEVRTLPTRGMSVTFSPDGTRLATANNDGTATVWDVASGKESQTLRGHTGRVFTVAFSPDGNRLATGGEDTTIKIWNVSPGASAGEQPLTLYGGSTTALTPQFSPDGKRLVAGWSWRGASGSVRVLALDLNDLLAIARSRVTRALTNDECQKYLHVDKCP